MGWLERHRSGLLGVEGRVGPGGRVESVAQAGWSDLVRALAVGLRLDLEVSEKDSGSLGTELGGWRPLHTV